MERALIVTASRSVRDMMAQFLRSHGFHKLTYSESGSEVRRLISSGVYTLVMIHAPLSDEFGDDLAAFIAESGSAAVVFVGDGEAGVSEKQSGISVIAEPLSRSVLFRAVREAVASRSHVQQENAKLLAKLDEMRLINRAKRALMQYLKFTEPQAHRYIEKKAMDTRSTRKEVALRILSTYE